MKLLADRDPSQINIAYHIAPCWQCGLRVVHSDKSGLPLHMHARSKRCRDLAAKRKKR